VIGFGLSLAIVLAVQAVAVQLWLKTAPDPEHLSAFTKTVAEDVAQQLESNPQLDVQAYIDRSYPKPFASIYIILSAGQRVVLRGPVRPSDADIRGGQEFYRNNPHPPSLPESWVTGPLRVAPIVVHGAVAGGVGGIVLQSWRELIGWRMAFLSAALLLLATFIGGIVVFGTIRRQLSDLEGAVGRFGGGDFDARADESGADELARLAAAFNQMARDLGARDAEVKAADRTRRLLLADVSHELMTPLTAIRAYREVLSMSPLASGADTARGLQVIADETQRLERLVGDLLDLARLEAGGESLAREDVSVENLFGRVAVRHEPEAKQKGIAVTTSIGAGAEILYGDPMRLEQALQNLAANALRNTPNGGEVDVRAELSGESVVLSVRDTGRGIPAEHRPYVFDRFYKVDPARAGDASAGSGLGLSIVRAIVERHGGAVSVTSEPGITTVFTIRLPISRAAA
jgi:signal transduction histidine kinase